MKARSHSRRRVTVCRIGFYLVAWVGSQLGYLAAAAGPDFTRDIRPLFERHCFECHGPKKQEAKLRFDQKPAEGRTAKSGWALVKPGQPEASELIRRVIHPLPEARMPAGEAALSSAEVAQLRAWVASGATWPAETSHWAFRLPVANPPPTLKQPEWARNEIDRFILARLEREGLSPAAAADRATLLRRLSLALIGLPPTVAETEAFVADPAPDALERQVERLLASPHYGEHQARLWLDLARYADTNGYELDRQRPVWPWRDWVIRAFNQNQRFDEFTVWQMAGDLLPNATDEQRIATGFHRHTLLNDEGGINVEEFRVAAVMDRVETTATVWLGQTFNCARCHSHKHDPFSQKEYFQFGAFLNQTQDSGKELLPVLQPVAPEHQARATWLREELDRCDARLKFSADRQAATKSTVADAGTFLEAFFLLVEEERFAPTELLRWLLRAPVVLAVKAHRSQYNMELQQMVTNSPTSLVLAEIAKPRETRLLLRGDHRAPGELVRPGVPAVLHPWPAGAPTNRLGLARWLTDPANPLVARVTVNRVWAQHFGRGLVATPDDFGTQGEPPSHPELLDWLAVEFMRTGWDLKALHRLIVTSATFRQSSRATPAALARDPLNVLLARGPRFRLDAEQIHDVALMASGRLSPRVGGPSVFPPQPPGVWEQSWAFGFDTKQRWLESPGEDRYRRGIYTFIRRTAMHPTAATFDMDNRTVCRVRRPRTNTPLQALTTLNDQLFLEAAAGLGDRMRRQIGADVDRLTFGFRCCITRPPEPTEMRLLNALLADARAAYQQDPTAAAALLRHARDNPGEPSEAAEAAAWLLTANALLNLDETLNQN